MNKQIVVKNKNMWKQILEERNLIEFNYQSEFWSNPKYLDPEKPLVLAFGTSGGKTLAAIIWLEIIYSNSANQNKKTIILAHGTKVIRSQFAKDIEDFGSKYFKYYVAKDRKDIENLPLDWNVLVVLPQTLNNSVDLFNKVDYMVVDEAHEWYFAKTVQNIIHVLKPTKQLLLTGTPFPFNAKKEDFLFYHVAVDKIRKENQAGNPNIQIVSTNFDFNYSDYNEDENLNSKVTFNYKTNLKMLQKVARQMIKTITSPIKKYPYTNRLTNNVLSVFGEMDKTLLIANSANMANDFFEILNKTMGGQVLLSHSQNDEESVEFDRFKKDDKYKILIVVNRGRLGFSMKELFNIVDFSFSTNVSVLLQILGRLLRLSNLQPNKEKFYYKVASRNTAGYVQDIMTGTLSLTLQENYENFDGNQKSIKIPRVKKRKKGGSGGGSKKTSSVDTRSIDKFLEMGVLDLDFWNEVKFKQSDKFGVTAWTTLEEVRRVAFKIQKGKYSDKQVYDDLIKEHNITTYSHFKEVCKKLELKGLPQKASKSEWDKNLSGKKDHDGKPKTPEQVLNFINENNIEEYKDFLKYPKGQVFRKYYKQYLESGEIKKEIKKGKPGIKKGSSYDEDTKKKLSETRKQLWKEGKYDNRNKTLTLINNQK